VLHRRGLARAVPALSMLVALMMASGASASPVVGPSGSAFYTPPSPLPAGGPGNLIWYRPTSVNLNVTLPSVNAWDVLYQSSDQQGQPDPVTGTVIVPTAAWTGTGKRPVVTIGIGTQGIAQSCAPSLAMNEGTEYDGGAIIAALKKNYAVVITDYQGYTNGAIPTYTAGKAEGQAVLDIVRAARQVPNSGISAEAPTIAWGYSQGGQAVGWAGELQPSYAPDVHLVGVAAGGTPGDLQALAEFGNGSVVSAFVLDSVIGLNAAYPGLFNLSSFTNEAGIEAEKKLLSECAIQSLSDFHDTNLSQLTVGNKTFAQIESENPGVKKIIEEQKLGTMPIPVPVYHYHGLEDEFVPVAQDAALHQAWCSLGVKDDFQLYPGDHLLTDPTAVGNVIGWISERLAGRAAPTTCGLHSPSSPLPPSARLTPETGDLEVPLPAWSIGGTVTEAKTGISIEVPAGATLSSIADVTKGTLTASLSIPPIDQTISVLGIPITVKGSLTPVGPIGGKVGLSDAGTFSLNASGAANMVVGSVGVGIFTVPIGCQTIEPLQLPLSLSSPVNALTLGIAIKSTVTVPPFGGCGIFGPVLTATMSGPNNPINLTATPPPPISF
jgi:Secretory lipase